MKYLTQLLVCYDLDMHDAGPVTISYLYKSRKGLLFNASVFK